MIGLVGCSKTKLDHSAVAHELYQSALFRRASTYAARTCDRWYILSAKHHLVRPDTVLKPYDVYLGDFTAEERRQWAAQVLSDLEEEGLLTADYPPCQFQFQMHYWLVLAGKKYRQFLVPELPGLAHIPLDGLGIGEQIAWLNDVLKPSLPPCRICKAAPATMPGDLCAGCAQAVAERRA